MAKISVNATHVEHLIKELEIKFNLGYKYIENTARMRGSLIYLEMENNDIVDATPVETPEKPSEPVLEEKGVESKGEEKDVVEKPTEAPKPTRKKRGK